LNKHGIKIDELENKVKKLTRKFFGWISG